MTIPRKHGRAEVVPAVTLPEVVFDAGEGGTEPAGGGAAEAVKATPLPEAMFDCQDPADGGPPSQTRPAVVLTLSASNNRDPGASARSLERLRAAVREYETGPSPTAAAGVADALKKCLDCGFDLTDRS